MSSLAAYVWRQSAVTRYLTCGRRFELEDVLGVELDHVLDGFASVSGTALHATLAQVCLAANAGRIVAPDELERLLLDAFETEVARLAEAGTSFDDEAIGPALTRLREEHLPRVVAFAADPRIHAIEWLGVERPFAFEAVLGGRARKFTGTIDAYGRAKRDIVGFGMAGREPVDLRRGQLVLVDWKTGDQHAVDWTTLALSVQLGVYRLALDLEDQAGDDVLAFLGLLQDLDRPKRPRDAQGNPIPSKLTTINPAWCAAAGVTVAEAVTPAAKNKRAKKDPVTGETPPKWLEVDNPAFVAACARPKGPLFHAARLDQGVVLRTVAAAVRGAEAGLFPAAGAVNGACARCPYRGRCAHREAA